MTIHAADRTELANDQSWLQIVLGWLRFDSLDNEATEDSLLSQISPFLLLPLAPLLGLLFLLFLPLVGFGMMFYILLQPLFKSSSSEETVDRPQS